MLLVVLLLGGELGASGNWSVWHCNPAWNGFNGDRKLSRLGRTTFREARSFAEGVVVDDE
jgi:hypothetical protein